MDISSIALQGLNDASAQLDVAVGQIASQASGSGGAGGPDMVSLSEEVVALMSAKTAVAANVSVLRTADQMQKSVLNVMA